VDWFVDWTRQRHRTIAELRGAEAGNEGDAERKAQLEREAAEARAVAELLDRQATKLEKADETRALWYAHTAETRATEQRARIELASRGIDPDAEDDRTPAHQWLADQRAGQADDDSRRELSGEHELSDVAERRAAELRALESEPPADATQTNPAGHPRRRQP
jgi:hypothetical protein